MRCQKKWQRERTEKLLEDIERNLFEKLMLEDDGKIQTKSKDYYHHQGLTEEPKTSSQHSICVLHSYINVLGWFLKVLYCYESGYECWVEKTTIIGEPIR